jgi:phosphosulfolactate synthase
MFDAPSKHQQVWFLQRFGPDVNLSNIAADDVLALETLRLGLRSDTLGIGQ